MAGMSNYSPTPLWTPVVNVFQGPRGSCQEEDTLSAALPTDHVGWLWVQDTQPQIILRGYVLRFLPPSLFPDSQFFAAPLRLCLVRVSLKLLRC